MNYKALAEVGLYSTSAKFLLKMGTVTQNYLVGLLMRLNILLVKCFVQCLPIVGPLQIVSVNSASTQNKH